LYQKPFEIIKKKSDILVNRPHPMARFGCPSRSAAATNRIHVASKMSVTVPLEPICHKVSPEIQTLWIPEDLYGNLKPLKAAAFDAPLTGCI